MGTSWSALVVNAPPAAQAAIEDTLARIIAQMSNWEAESDISRFNRAGFGEWVALPPEMMTVLRAGLEMAEISSGAFDPAVGRLVERWGFGPSGIIGPVMENAHPAPWTAIEVESDRARRLADVALDFSGIAKGYAVDAVGKALKALGTRQFLVEIGGELRGEGIRPDGQPWWVDAECPPDLSLPTLRIALCGMSVATSGDYRKVREDNGRRWSHSMDPVTGEPSANGVRAVTVLHESAMWADAWATAITVLGHERGMALATRHGVAARLVRREEAGAREYVTPELARMVG